MIVDKVATRFANTASVSSMASRFQRQQSAVSPAKLAAEPSISQAGRELLVADAENGYRLDGEAHSLMDYANAKGALYKMTDAQVAEIKLREQQEQSRQAANLAYAQSHAYNTVGQVFVNGQLLASVDESGGYYLAHNIGGLSAADMSASERLAEIAKAVGGEIRTSNFEDTGGWSGPGAPESSLPAITARSLQEILEQDVLPLTRTK
ncbi:hypothetical protein [Propionivibrio soli]|uniref:hypothetical protein n=1 Tax=Propionivibrio soli TaxID=2976531 RepID=UPI0021E84F92|nr:hypothetical protein [Propionivibrio soli]